MLPFFMVYIVLACTTNLVKIGYCSDIKKRLGQLSTHCPVKLEILSLFYRDDRVVEQQLHRRFARYRTRGEWFTLEGELFRFVKDNPFNDPKIKQFLSLQDEIDDLTHYERLLEKESQS
jgi:hypothetical protein